MIAVLSTLSANDSTKWYGHVFKVQRCLNGTYQRSIKIFTSFELLFGIKMRDNDEKLQKIINRKEIVSFANKKRVKIIKTGRRTYYKNRKRANDYTR